MDQHTKLIQTYLTLSGEKLEVAHELFRLSRFDDAISRAYYAMFHAAKAALLAINIETRSHAGVLNQFSKHFVKTGYASSKYSRMLAWAMQARETSDYSPTAKASALDAEQTIANAEAFQNKVQEILNKLAEN